MSVSLLDMPVVETLSVLPVFGTKDVLFYKHKF